MEKNLLVPLHDVVIIKKQEVDQIGSILIPIQSEDFKEDIGIVAYVGPGALEDGNLRPMYVKPGDRVLFSTHGHQVTKIDGEEMIVLRQNSIIAVFKAICPLCMNDVSDVKACISRRCPMEDV